MVVTLLRAESLAIGYGRTQIASGIDLTIRAGTITCLLGPNGCGKTTLLKTLIGLIPPLAGSVTVDDAPVASLSATEKARRIAYVPQQHAPPFPFTVGDVVMMGRQAHLGLFAAPGKRDRERVVAVLAQIGMAHLFDADYSRLSGGQRQMVLIARALAQDTTLLVLDEPTASLDFGNQALILSETARLARAGFTILMSTHDPDHAFAVADDVILMKNGAILARGAPRETLTAKALQDVYGIEIAVETLTGGTTIAVPQIQGVSRRRG
jgi:iron complex transport system ATP-binding protein